MRLLLSATRFTCIGLLLCTTLHVAYADDLDALTLADNTQTSTQTGSDWQLFTEAAFASTAQRYQLADLHTERWSFDARFDKTLAPGLRLVASDRIDVISQDQLAHHSTVNTLKEAYLSWQASDQQIIDLGRINVRNGVALGYNPSDFFRVGALRSVTSLDPASLRSNRLGSVMLRAQQLWNSGSVTALLSPKLADQPSNAPFNIDLGATNHQQRWLLSASTKLSDSLNPQWLIIGAEHQVPQFGFNLSELINDATIAYVEWSGGRSRSFKSLALQGADDQAFRSRLASGITYTSENKISFTAEYDYNGAGLDQQDWQTLGNGSPLSYNAYRQWAQTAQDPATKHNVFFYVSAQDAFINHLDLTAMLRTNLADHSRLTWLESRYHFDHIDLALQWQNTSGTTRSEFGALSQQRVLQIGGTYFF